MSRSRSNSADSDSAHSEGSGYSSCPPSPTPSETPSETADYPPASPPAAPAPSPASAPSPVLAHRCFRCGDPATRHIVDGDGAAGLWACRDCDASSCEHCREAATSKKAAVCDCPKKAPCKKRRAPTPPPTEMDESE